MHIIKVKQGGKLRIWDTVRMNVPTARTAKNDRKSLKEIMERRKRAERDARLVKFF